MTSVMSCRSYEEVGLYERGSIYMYFGGITFLITKSFGRLQLVPESSGLRFVFTPVVENEPRPDNLGFIDVLVPLDAVGGLWATARAFLYEFESLDENIILSKTEVSDDNNDILVKLYRDKPHGEGGRLTGNENTWLRIVTGRTEEERRRIKLGARDLLSIDLACSAVMSLAVGDQTHKPQRMKFPARIASNQ
jgi:hypothetical protein